MSTPLRSRGGWLLLCLTFITVSVLAFTLARGRATAAPTANSKIPPGLAVVAHAFKEQYVPGEAVSLLVAFGNSGEKTLYLSGKEDFTLPYMLTVKDAKGDMVAQKAPLDDPGPPPPDHYMQIEGRQVLVTPLVEVKSGEATAAILSDVLAAYQPLDPGKYTITVVTGFGAYEQKNVLQRTDHLHTLWTRAESRFTPIRMDAGTVTIEIAKP